MTEQAPPRPTGFYGRTKLFCEWLIEAYGRSGGFRHAILRYFNAEGAHADGTLGEDHRPETHLIPRLLHAAMRPDIPGSSLTIHGDRLPTPDGTRVRDYVHVQDLAEAHVRALSHLSGGGRSVLLNLGTGRGFSVKEVVAAAGRVVGREISVRIGPPRRGDPAVLVASNALAHEVLGWVPRRSDLDTILATALAWRRAHPDGYADDPSPSGGFGR